MKGELHLGKDPILVFEGRRQSGHGLAGDCQDGLGVIFEPAGCGALGAEPPEAGQDYTADVTGDEGSGRWRAVLLSWAPGDEGVYLEMEIEGRYGEDQKP